MRYAELMEADEPLLSLVQALVPDAELHRQAAKITVTVPHPSDLKRLMAAEPKFHDHGWFVSWSNDQTQITFEPIRGEPFHPTEPLWHVTWRRRLPVIRKQGLQPRAAKGRGDVHDYRYPPRVYLATDLQAAADYYGSVGGLPNVEIDDFVLLRIEPAAVTGLTFFHDPLLPGGVYTLEPIPAGALAVDDMAKVAEALGEY